MSLLKISDTHLEGWLVRGKAQMRIFGQRTAADRKHLPVGWYTVALQPVENGLVQAWAPVWREEIHLGEVQARLMALQAEGWAISRSRVSELDWQAAGRQGGRQKKAPAIDRMPRRRKPSFTADRD
jgi:hypothetical protein